LPFDFTRASNGTFVNKSGLIETAANGVPRIDFLGSTSGALKLEPQRSNLIPYSDRFNSPPFWSQVALTVSNNATISPDGTLNASKITRTSTSGNARLVHSSVAVSSGAKATLSAFFKYDGTDEIILFSPITLQGKRFSLQNATAGADFVSAPDGYGIENYGNGWYRFYIVVTAPSTSVDLTIYVQNNATTSIYLFGAQIEQGSYSTSLINTQGSAVTRVADVCNNGGNDQVINSTEGTLYVEANLIDGYDNNNFLATIFDNSNNDGNHIFIQRYLGNIQAKIKVGTTQAEITESNTTSGSKKIAFTYKANEFKMFVNGSQIGSTDTSGSVFSANTLDKINVGSYYNNTLNFNSVINEIKLYNTALTDAELIALTTI
jgi:hypothetical protein